ncbi:MAG: DUF1249 domain-containing protein [Gammaproteobacteria bacterium]|nr:DUF1249 domain-containing protein [Gammaproteobacteria bacterium]NIR59752.1 DUF1249 domain-containing protein [Gammaproteobacteria bacterium]NIR89562.1 DUF1249 domain-containing protein [Gammaproteobacteria bacterium]NIV74804.1 DUF1249 domain-containing protein [Gammaproteobacteria bacterium]
MQGATTAKLALQQPRDLSGLIDMYTGNYFRLMRLVPELDDLHGTRVSRVAGALDLYLTVLERWKYTTTIALTYRFPDMAGEVAEPNARIRVYHDVKAVEVLSHCRRRHRPVGHGWRRGHKPELNHKWELNRFLNKWLGFCLRQGHIFLRCTARPAEPPLLARRASDGSARL